MTNFVLTFFLLVLYTWIFGFIAGSYSIGYGSKKDLNWIRLNGDYLTPEYKKNHESELNTYLEKVKSVRSRRVWFFRLASLVIFVWFSAISPNIEFFFTQIVIFSFLLWLCAVDLEDQQLPDNGLLWLLGAITVFYSFIPAARWTQPDSLILGFACVLIFIFISTVVTKKLFGIDKSTMILGDGDVIVLTGLTLFYGVDIVFALAIGCMFLAIAGLFKGLYLRLLTWIGYIPKTVNTEPNMAFVPFIMLGLLCTVSFTLTGIIDFSGGIEELHRWFILDGAGVR